MRREDWWRVAGGKVVVASGDEPERALETSLESLSDGIDAAVSGR
jgi:hypothetical protein